VRFGAVPVSRKRKKKSPSGRRPGAPTPSRAAQANPFREMFEYRRRLDERRTALATESAGPMVDALIAAAPGWSDDDLEDDFCARFGAAMAQYEGGPPATAMPHGWAPLLTGFRFEPAAGEETPAREPHTPTSARVSLKDIPCDRRTSSRPNSGSVNRKWNIRSRTSHTRSSVSSRRLSRVALQAPASPSALPCGSRSASSWGLTRRRTRDGQRDSRAGVAVGDLNQPVRLVPMRRPANLDLRRQANAGS